MEKGRLQIKKKKKTIISTIKITYTIEGKRPDRDLYMHCSK